MTSPKTCRELAEAYWVATGEHGADSPEAYAASDAYYAAECPPESGSGGSGQSGPPPRNP